MLCHCRLCTCAVEYASCKENLKNLLEYKQSQYEGGELKGARVGALAILDCNSCPVDGVSVLCVPHLHLQYQRQDL